MELFERAANREAVSELLDELLAAAGDGVGTPPVWIEGRAMLVPAELYDLFVRLIEEHDLGEQVQQAVDADFKRQQLKLRETAEELGLDPDEVAPRLESASGPPASS